MVRTSLIFLITGLALSANAQELPTADAVVNRYLEACGGRAAINKVQDMSLSLKAETPNGLAVIDVDTKQGHKFLQVIYLGGTEVSRTVSDGAKVTTSRGGKVVNTLEGSVVLRQLLSSSLFGEQFYDKYNVFRRTLSHETLRGQDTYKVEFSTGNGEKWHDWFDVQTGYRIQRTLYYRTANGLATSTTRFWNYKPVDGVVLPFSRSQTFGTVDATLTVNSIKVNTGLNDKLFQAP